MSKSKKYNINRKNSRFNKSKKNMKGGFSSDELQHLLDNGFQQHQIDELSNLNITIDTINEAIQYYNNNFNAHEIIVDIAKNLNSNLPPLSNIGLDNNTNQQQTSQQQTNESMADNSQINNSSQNSSNGSLLNINDLQVPEGHEIPQDENDVHNLDMNQSLDLSGDTSLADESMNSSTLGSLNNSTNNSTNNSMNGGKKRRPISKKYKKSLKGKKSHRRLKGGAMYGNGYGANCNDPNFSIYNTNLTKLFPYRPK